MLLCKIHSFAFVFGILYNEKENDNWKSNELGKNILRLTILKNYLACPQYQH